MVAKKNLRRFSFLLRVLDTTSRRCRPFGPSSSYAAALPLARPPPPEKAAAPPPCRGTAGANRRAWPLQRRRRRRPPRLPLPCHHRSRPPRLPLPCLRRSRPSCLPLPHHRRPFPLPSTVAGHRRTGCGADGESWARSRPTARQGVSSTWSSVFVRRALEGQGSSPSAGMGGLQRGGNADG